MFSPSDTIVAIATPPGRGGIGIVRLSGAEAKRIARALIDRELGPPRQATVARLVSGRERVAAEGPAEGTGRTRAAAVDEVVVTCFAGPASYTGEDVAEVSAHGSPYVLQHILRASVAQGARLAEPGEFTLRAHLNGRLDLVQAEAVADLVEAVTPLQARAAFDQLDGTLSAAIRALERQLFDLLGALEASIDFPDEGYHFIRPEGAAAAIGDVLAQVEALLGDAERGRLVREGRRVAIVGTPNGGKSSLFNYLVGCDRAIVTDVPGTTRDVLTEVLDLEGLRVTLVDTAGIREGGDAVEEEGVARARQAAVAADAVLLVVDVSRPLSAGDRALIEETGNRDRLVVRNKMDLDPAWLSLELDPAAGPVVETSVVTGQGLHDLRRAVRGLLEHGEERREVPAVTNLRHITLLRSAQAALQRAYAGCADGRGPLPEECMASDVQEARQALEEVTGKRRSGELLEHIFSRFCIGK